MRFALLIAALVAGTTGALGACSKFDAVTDDPDAGPGAAEGGVANDAGALDASGVDAAGEDAGGLPNLHPNGTFESGLAPWAGFQGDLARSRIPHSGAWSAQMCQSGSDMDFDADDEGSIEHPAHGTYHATAWLRNDPANPASRVVSIHLRTRVDGSDGETNSSDPIPLTETWLPIDVTLDVTQDSDELDIYVLGNAVAGTNACFLVDDVVLTKDP